MTRRWTIAMIVALAGMACGPRVQPIDLHDETIPIEARKLVADAEDSIEIARADLDEARRDLERTIEWKNDLLGRDWPTDADSAIRKLETMAAARVRLEELEVERAEERLDVAKAKYDLITAKTAIRHDLAIYELQPLRKTLRREEQDVEQLEGQITTHRERLARKVDEWWSAYKSYARQDGNTRLLYVSAAREIAKRDLRTPSEEEDDESAEKSETEAAPDLDDMVDEELEGGMEEGDEASSEGEGNGGDESAEGDAESE